MKSFFRCCTGLGLLLGARFAAHAQPTALQAQVMTTVEPAPAEVAAQRARYAAAHDSLLRLAEGVHLQAESRLRFFKATKSGLNSSRRRVRGFAAPPSMTVDYAGIKSTAGGGIVKDQIIRRRFGTELEKVVYYDARHRKVLTERYDNHQLVQLVLSEYADVLSVPFSQWQLVRGGYLRHTTRRLLFQAPGKSFFYFDAMPVTE
ncbi:hypothetical protein [Hymenobacter daeguensis]